MTHVRSVIPFTLATLADRVVARGVPAAIDALDRLHEAASRDRENADLLIDMADWIRLRLGMRTLRPDSNNAPMFRPSLADQYARALNTIECLRAERDELLLRMGEK